MSNPLKRGLRALAKGAFHSVPLTDEQRYEVRRFYWRMRGRGEPPPPALVPSPPLKISLAELAARRERLLRAAFAPGERALLLISHRLGGGTDQHVSDMAERMRAEGWRIFFLERYDTRHVQLRSLAEKGEVMLFRWPDEADTLPETLSVLGIEHMHLHHTADFPVDFVSKWRAIAERAGIPYDYTVHDYYPICPRFTVFDEAVGAYCGEPRDVRKCTSCVQKFGSAVGHDVDVRKWRDDFRHVLDGARSVFVPDGDVQQRLTGYFPAARLVRRAHPEQISFTPVARVRQSGERLRVVTVGAIGAHKGSGVFLRCAKEANERKLPIDFQLIGFSDIDPQLRSCPNISMTGRFLYKNLPTLLQQGGYHLAFLPSVIPETFSYALSDCWRHGLYTVCFDIGAMASRTRSHPTLGTLLPLEWFSRPSRINDLLLSMDVPALEELEVCGALQTYGSMTQDYYGMGQRSGEVHADDLRRG